MIGRRGVFKALMAVPFAARQAADTAIGAVTGLGASPVAAVLGGDPASDRGPPPAGRPSEWSLFDIAKRALEVPIPQWRADEIRRESKYVYRLDPDIAALRSFSMSAKLCWQRERDFQMRMERTRTVHQRRALASDFEGLHGFWFWG